MLEPIVYIIQCVLGGLCGSQRRMDFFGRFIRAIITTPLVGLSALLLTGPSRHAEWRCRS
jgi:hypothetical protein